MRFQQKKNSHNNHLAYLVHLEFEQERTEYGAWSSLTPSSQFVKNTGFSANFGSHQLAMELYS